nr:MAG TPA: hypothetical protein [Caudoviricetes sp.]
MTAKKQPPRLRLWRCFSNRKGIRNRFYLPLQANVRAVSP